MGSQVAEIWLNIVWEKCFGRFHIEGSEGFLQMHWHMCRVVVVSRPLQQCAVWWWRYKWGPKVAEMRRLTQRKWPCLASQVSCTAKQVSTALYLYIALLHRWALAAKQVAPHTADGPQSTAGPLGPGGLHNVQAADPQGPSSVLKIRRAAGPEGARVLLQ